MGNITQCGAKPENRGKGNCPHLLHQDEEESDFAFLDRTQKFKNDNPDKICKYDKKVKSDLKHPIESYRLEELKKRIKDKGEEDDVELFDHCVRDMKNYAIAVLEHRHKVMEAAKNRDRHNPQEYIQEIQHIDEMRSNAHNVTMTGIRILNKVSEWYGAEPIFEGELSNDNRNNVSEAIFKFFGTYDSLTGY